MALIDKWTIEKEALTRLCLKGDFGEICDYTADEIRAARVNITC